jgi:hypothetical protein
MTPEEMQKLEEIIGPLVAKAREGKMIYLSTPTSAYEAYARMFSEDVKPVTIKLEWEKKEDI